jgi:hypothetical protein
MQLVHSLEKQAGHPCRELQHGNPGECTCGLGQRALAVGPSPFQEIARPSGRAVQPSSMILPYLNSLSHKRIILASASPRRKELLSNLGLKFEVRSRCESGVME